MGADVAYRVTVLRVVEDEVVVYALTGDDAKEEAEQEPNVVRALVATQDPNEALDL